MRWMLSVLGWSVLALATAFEMYPKTRQPDGGREGWVDRHMLQAVRWNINGGMSVVGIWVPSIQFFGCLCLLEKIFLMLRGKKKYIWKPVRKLLFWKLTFCLSLAITVRFFSLKPKLHQLSTRWRKWFEFTGQDVCRGRTLKYSAGWVSHRQTWAMGDNARPAL